MKSLKTIGLLFLFAALLFTSCRKDEEIIGSFPSETPPDPEVIVNGSFSGVVINETNQAIEDALITLGPNTTMTDENGYFSFKNVEINERGSLVTIEKANYFYNSKFVNSKLNKHNFTNIKLIEKVLTGTFSANTGGSVSTNDGATIQFAANAIKLESGGVYTGNVNVYATWLNPTSPDLAQLMPGDLRATNADNVQQQLTSFGMIGVELEGDAGEALNIADGQMATIEVPVPAELVNNAPTSIPLWHMDESSGYWLEDGEARLLDDKYVGTVSHFSFWNFDVSGEFVYLEGTLTDTGGAPLPNTLVTITQVSNGMAGFGWTNEDGVFAGAVPKDEELNISVKDNCGNQIYSSPVGPFSEDAIIPTIAINTEENFYTVFGTLVDCDNNPLANGYLKLDFGFGPLIVLADENGAFSETVNICNATTVDVTGYNIVDFKKSNTLTEDLNGISTLDLANVFVCENLTEFMIYTIAGIETIDEDPLASFESGSGAIILNAFVAVPPMSLANPAIQLRTTAPSPGIYSPKFILASYVDGNPTMNIVLNCNNTSECDVSVEFTTIEAVGGFVIGSFSGTMINSPVGGGPPEDVEVSGSFKVMIE